MSDIDDRFEAYLAHSGGEMVGWSFSSMTTAGRMSAEQIPWSYGSLVIPLIDSATDMLDMGTGGGEILCNLRPLPANTHATEGWMPNVVVARERLEPLGVTVHGFERDDDPLPFADHSLDLVLNRHESYDPVELRRVLRPGGNFITQQIGGQNDADLNELLGTPPAEDYSDWTLDHAMEELSAAGLLVVDGQEAFPATRFYDIGALIFYLKAVPWQIEDFSVENHRVQLYDIHLLIEQQGWLEVGGHRFLIRAEAPDNVVIQVTAALNDSCRGGSCALPPALWAGRLVAIHCESIGNTIAAEGDGRLRATAGGHKTLPYTDMVRCLL